MVAVDVMVRALMRGRERKGSREGWVLSLEVPVVPITDPSHRYTAPSHWSTLLPLLDPHDVLLKSNPFTAAFEDWYHPFVEVVGSWTSVRVLTVEDCELRFVRDRECLGGEGGAVTLVVKVVPEILQEDFFLDMMQEGSMFEIKRSRVNEVVVQLPDLETMVEQEEMFSFEMSDYWKSERYPLSMDEIARRMAMLRFEVAQ